MKSFFICVNILCRYFPHNKRIHSAIERTMIRYYCHGLLYFMVTCHNCCKRNWILMTCATVFPLRTLFPQWISCSRPSKAVSELLNGYFPPEPRLTCTSNTRYSQRNNVANCLTSAKCFILNEAAAPWAVSPTLNNLVYWHSICQ